MGEHSERYPGSKYLWGWLMENGIPLHSKDQLLIRTLRDWFLQKNLPVSGRLVFKCYNEKVTVPLQVF
jgi:hypothetical protein